MELNDANIYNDALKIADQQLRWNAERSVEYHRISGIKLFSVNRRRAKSVSQQNVDGR